MNQWWYIDDDASQIRGPCDRIQIGKWSEAGWLRPETLVARTPTRPTSLGDHTREHGVNEMLRSTVSSDSRQVDLWSKRALIVL